jgi:hypothetical protein
VITDKRGQILGLGTETEGYRELEQKTDMKIAEVSPDAVQQKYILFTPLEKSLLAGSVLDYTIEDFAHEHCHRILEDIVPYSQKGMSGGNVSGGIEIGSGAFNDISLKNIER